MHFTVRYGVARRLAGRRGSADAAQEGAERARPGADWDAALTRSQPALVVPVAEAAWAWVAVRPKPAVRAAASAAPVVLLVLLRIGCLVLFAGGAR